MDMCNHNDNHDKLSTVELVQHCQDEISFVPTLETLMFWNSMKHQKSLSDSQLAEFLVLFYKENTWKSQSCLTCQNPFSSYCSNCYDIILHSRISPLSHPVENVYANSENNCRVKKKANLPETVLAVDFKGQLRTEQDEAGLVLSASSNENIEKHMKGRKNPFVMLVRMRTVKKEKRKKSVNLPQEGAKEKEQVQNLHLSPKSEPDVFFEPKVSFKQEFNTVDKAIKDVEVEKKGDAPIIGCEWCNVSFASLREIHIHLIEHSSPQWQQQQLLKADCEETNNPVSDCATELEEGFERRKKEKLVLNKKKQVRRKAHEQDKAFICTLCGTDYHVALSLTKHLQKKHLNKPAFKCCGCNKLFPSINLLEEHISMRLCPQIQSFGHTVGDIRMVPPLSQRPYMCRICHRRFQFLSFLSNHVKQHGEPNPFLCAGCRRAFSKLSDLTGHRCNASRMSALRATFESLSQPFPAKADHINIDILNNSDMDGTAVCDQETIPETIIPGEALDLSISLQKASDNIFASSIPEIALDSLTSPNYFSLKKTPCPKSSLAKAAYKHKCQLCSKAYKTDLMLRRHMQIHTGRNAFQCTFCDQSFPSQSAMYKHQENDHWSGGPIQCRECGRTVKSAQALEQHMREHTGEMPFECEECGRHFKSYPMLSIHRRTHRNEKGDCYKCHECGETFLDWASYKFHMDQHQNLIMQHLCPQCGASFAEKRFLKLHIEKVHQGKKNFVCEHCGEQFYEAYNHKLHVWRHTGYKPHACTLCDKRFLRKEKLKQHMACLHSTEKPFKCDQCPKAYKVKYRLLEHTRSIHTGERPFKCAVCGKCFAVSGVRKAHMRTHKNCLPQKRPTLDVDDLP